jgi:beta-glucanase (GH16 family)
MEAVGFEYPPIIHGTLHNAMKGKEPLFNRSVPLKDACDAFHNYQLDWRPDSITMYVDGRPFLHKEKGEADYAHWPYDHPFYLAMNVTVGGAWGGAYGIDPSIRSASMEIDYVRVYQMTKTP